MTASRVPAAPVAIVEGDEFPVTEIGPLTRTDFVRYAGASGDFNPIHYDDVLATGLGLPSVFGMGMLHGGALGIRLARWVGPDNLRSFSVRFSGQVWPGDVLTMRGQVVAVEREGGEPIAEIELTVESPGRGVVLLGRARAVVV
jgi:acyl dehydratase